MVFHSELPKKAYLATMKDNMSGHFEFGSDRFTGFFIGNFFYVTYHSGYEWNRRISNQKNAAVGFVKKSADGEEGCDVHFFKFKGMLCPLVFLPMYFLFVGVMLVEMLRHSVWSSEILWTCCGYALAVMAVCAPIATVIESLTDGSIEGERILLSCLANPEDPYGSIEYFP